MKKILSAVLVCVLLATCVFALVSCGKTLSGKYESAITGGKVYEFSGSKVTITYKTILGNITNEGTYKIETKDDKEVITITIDNEEGDEDLSGTYDFVSGKEGDTEYIKIGALKYNKVKK